MGNILNIEQVSLRGMRLLVNFYGLSESGKSLSALLVASGIEPDPSKRMLLDTEGGGRGRAYVNDIPGGYLYASLSPPYTPERYKQAIDEIVKAGVTVLVTDSISHVWAAEGGVLEMAEQSTVKNEMARWKDPKRRLEKMLQRYRSSDMHHILCARAKQPLVEAVVDGRKSYVPGPVVPIFEKMLRFDMTVVAQMLGRGAFTIEAPAGKCPGNLQAIFAASPLMNIETGRRLAEWIGAQTVLSPELRALKVAATEAAEHGATAFRDFWGPLDKLARDALRGELGNYQSIAQAADAERERLAEEARAEGQTTDERADPALDDPFGGKGIEHAQQEDAFGLKPLPNSPAGVEHRERGATTQGPPVGDANAAMPQRVGPRDAAGRTESPSEASAEGGAPPLPAAHVLREIAKLRPPDRDLAGERDWRPFVDEFVALIERGPAIAAQELRISDLPAAVELRRENGDEYRRITAALAERAKT